MELGRTNDRVKKRPLSEIMEEKVYKFMVLLPNGTSVSVTFRDPKNEMPLDEFIYVVKQRYIQTMEETESLQKSRIRWNSGDIWFEDAFDNKIKNKICFGNFKAHKSHIITLHDGSGAVADTYENMWDLTPNTDLLTELSDDYAFESALADLIDNSLQAVWVNGVNEKKLISVELEEDRISIFDSGPGMDDSVENCIVKWGKMGASLHRSSREQAIGGKPPYLVPFFGMFGYGGSIASMHLGRRALVSSKRKESKKAYTLYLERDALLRSSGSTWGTKGGIRNPLKDDIQKSPHGSFTKVEILELKLKKLEIFQLQCKLKDIYFPYIQCDEVSSTGRTITPVDFQVNGVDLAEVEGGEVAITNLHSCNGPDFVLQLHLLENDTSKSPGSKAYKANARLKCVYFPVVEGKENIERILEKLESDGFGVTENFETFGRVSIRRLGRLLPDARWASLPFMEPKQKKGDKAQILKKCCFRAKCFIDTDAGFCPTPSKTDLAQHHIFTTVLKNLGNKPSEKEKDVSVDIYRDKKKLTLGQLEREYQEWLFKMHDSYDEEVDCGQDQPVLVVGPDKKALGISSDVVRVHQVIKRKGKSWKHGQKIKVLKGACSGIHKKNLYATLEYFLLEGLQGEARGDARIICRPLDVPDKKGCILAVNNGNPGLDICGSLSLPISVIDSGKCLALDTAEWECQLEKQHKKSPSIIDILNAKCCEELDIDGAFPEDVSVNVGYVPPSKIVAVVRPACFISSSASNNLDQRYIIKDNLEMCLEVKFSAEMKDQKGSHHLFSRRGTPSSHKGLHGLYFFPVGSKLPDLFKKAGVYTFTFSCPGITNCIKRVLAKASSEVRRWEILSDARCPQYKVRVGAHFPPLSVACYDLYNNRIPFPCIPEVVVELKIEKHVLARVDKMKVNLSSDNLTLKVEDVLIESGELDTIRPTYEATLVISSPDDLFSASLPCHVTPGPLQQVTAQPPNFGDGLQPGHIIEDLVLEMFDAYKNHVRKDFEVLLDVNGLAFQDRMGPKRKVNSSGLVDLRDILKITAGYGENVSLSVIDEAKVVFIKEFKTEKRELKIATKVPEFPAAGSQLENLAFEIVNPEGDVDETIHDDQKYGHTHTLTVKSVSMGAEDSVRYAFRYGRCIVPAITLPQEEGVFCFVAAHSCHPEIHLSVKVQVVKATKVEYINVGSPCSDGRIPLLLDDSVSKHAENFVESPSIVNEEKKLNDDCLKFGVRIGDCEKRLKTLMDEEATIKQEMAHLQDSLDLESSICFYENFAKEDMMELIENKDDSASSFICNISRTSLSQEAQAPFIKDIVGVVALLGTVRSTKISRILAEYLGEDQMLAVVCRSRAAADALEQFAENGVSDQGHSLYSLAASLGKYIKGRFVVICLEDIRPFTGGLVDAGFQKILDLPSPTLSNGNFPLGFLGYAVNVIDIESNQLSIMTAAGHGLRETLFYRLFGEIQVYETMEQLKLASDCIKSGAVSLDGGISRGNGVISLGYREPEIFFPVVDVDSQPLSLEDRHIVKLIEEKREELRNNSVLKAKVTNLYEKAKKKFKKRDAKYHNFLGQNGHLLRGYYLEYRPNAGSSS